MARAHASAAGFGYQYKTYTSASTFRTNTYQSTIVQDDGWESWQIVHEICKNKPRQGCDFEFAGRECHAKALGFSSDNAFSTVDITADIIKALIEIKNLRQPGLDTVPGVNMSALYGLRVVSRRTATAAAQGIRKATGRPARRVDRMAQVINRQPLSCVGNRRDPVIVREEVRSHGIDTTSDYNLSHDGTDSEMPSLCNSVSSDEPSENETRCSEDAVEKPTETANADNTAAVFNKEETHGSDQAVAPLKHHDVMSRTIRAASPVFLHLSRRPQSRLKSEDGSQKFASFLNQRKMKETPKQSSISATPSKIMEVPNPIIEVASSHDAADSTQDPYWQWDIDTQKFRHWDEEHGEFIICPDHFD